MSPRSTATSCTYDGACRPVEPRRAGTNGGFRVRRGSFEMIANLSADAVDVTHEGTEVIVSAGTVGEGDGDAIRLGPFSGVVVR